jgi:glycosyltransferase involved in cell wall biosynthesis
LQVRGILMISAIMSVYNTDKFVARTIRSILSQTHKVFEFIIIDDASTDNSPEILDKFSRKDSRITVITNKINLGIGAARNKGLEIASGEYMAVVDSDDISLPQRFARQIQFLDNNHDYCGLGTEVIYVDPEGSPLNMGRHSFSDEQINRQLLSGNGDAIPHPSFICRTEPLRRVGGYDETFIGAEDLDLFLRLAEIGKLGNLEEKLVKVRRRASSINHQRSDLWREMKYKALTKTMQRRGIEIDLGGINVGNMYSDDYRLHWAKTASRSGFFQTAIKNFTISVLNNGLQKKHIQFLKILTRDIHQTIVGRSKP